MRPVTGVPVASTAPRDGRAQLRRMAHQLEAVFLAQLFQAMRASVPDDAQAADTPGRELYQSLLDDQLASQAAARSERGLGEALYRQLSRRLQAGDGSAGQP